MTLNTESKSALRIKFFELLYESQEGYLCIATSLPDIPKASFKQRFFSWPDDYRKMENFILAREKSQNVYFCINLLDKHERKKANCLPSRLLWADIDNAPLEKVETIPPPILIRSSPGRHQAIWRLSTELPPYQAEDYSRRLSYLIDADKSGWDLTQLLRVPFTHNMKYEDRPEVVLERALETTAAPLLFEALPPVGEESELATAELPKELPGLESIMYTHKTALSTSQFLAVYTQEPTEGEDWSRILWRLIHLLFESGLSAEEVFVVAQNAPCNKYARDNRPIEHLWREVLKAEMQQKKVYILDADYAPLTMPRLVEEPATGTVLDSYRDWASEATDAIVQFHDLGCMILLSSIMANSVRLETSWGALVPNLWGLILGDSTLARKTTSMQMILSFLNTLDNQMVIATDGSAEGLLTGLATRPNKVSVFYKDEVSGFFDSINKKDYLAGMPEVLTHLYDVPQIYTRRLRKETIHIESPAFVFFGGGIRDRVYGTVDEEYVVSGFLPRFLVVSGAAERENLRRTGPATPIGKEKRDKLLTFFSDLFELYSMDAPIRIGGQQVMMPQRITANLTQEAWDFYGDIEDHMTKTAHESYMSALALPTFDRLSRSMLKVAVILAGTRQEPADDAIQVTIDDVKNAAWYIQDWGRFSVELITNAGLKPGERLLTKITNIITEHPGILRSTLMQHYHLSKREADDVLSTLEDRQVVRKERQGRGWRYYIT